MLLAMTCKATLAMTGKYVFRLSCRVNEVSRDIYIEL